jgi:hypothetical protein
MDLRTSLEHFMPPDSLPELDEIPRRILEFLQRHYPFETIPTVFEQRMVVCGELRLALHEYDAACGELDRLGLIVTDPPYAHDCDFIALTPAGRRAVTRPPQPGSLAWAILEILCQTAQAVPGASQYTSAAQVLPALGVPQDAAGQRAFQSACQALYNWGWITRRAVEENGFGEVAPTPAGRQAMIAGKS